MLNKIGKNGKIAIICLFVVPIILLLFLLIIRGCSSSNSYSKYEKNMISAAEKYFTNKNSLPKTEGGTVSVSLDDLISNDYIKSTEKKLDDKSCKGSVTVRNNGASVKNNNGGYYLYIPDLKCENYKTVHLIDKLLNDVVTEKSGLYATTDGYVYRGSKVNNYVSFFGKKYMIVNIDNNGILKLVKLDSEEDSVEWDFKYNPEVDYSYGKNDFSDSNILDELTGNYLVTSDEKKVHMVAHNVCYGNRNTEYTAIDYSNECSKVLDNQFITLLSVPDFSMASYDVDCDSIYSGSCSNYNYLYDRLYSTWLLNGITDNSYEVYYFGGYIYYTLASRSNLYNMVIFIDGNELYVDGDGSASNPYVIK